MGGAEGLGAWRRLGVLGEFCLLPGPGGPATARELESWRAQLENDSTLRSACPQIPFRIVVLAPWTHRRPLLPSYKPQQSLDFHFPFKPDAIHSTSPKPGPSLPSAEGTTLGLMRGLPIVPIVKGQQAMRPPSGQDPEFPVLFFGVLNLRNHLEMFWTAYASH